MCCMNETRSVKCSEWSLRLESIYQGNEERETSERRHQETACECRSTTINQFPCVFDSKIIAT